ncbi:hypothetical protein BDZ89DRAFT_1140258 [Hymenopellis radicata]|nr:hypothetical protein BDZ89DRAFT_1140258 [Hymenopellis radicata]
MRLFGAEEKSEEAPAPGLSAELRADLGENAVAAANAVKYLGAGTVELNFNKLDFKLVEWQLEAAAWNPLALDQSSLPLVGHAFEASRTPRNQFLPGSGPLLYLSTPTPTHVFAPTQTRDVSPSLRLEQGFNPLTATIGRISTVLQ